MKENENEFIMNQNSQNTLESNNRGRTILNSLESNLRERYSKSDNRMPKEEEAGNV